MSSVEFQIVVFIGLVLTVTKRVKVFGETDCIGIGSITNNLYLSAIDTVIKLHLVVELDISHFTGTYLRNAVSWYSETVDWKETDTLNFCRGLFYSYELKKLLTITEIGTSKIIEIKGGRKVIAKSTRFTLRPKLLQFVTLLLITKFLTVSKIGFRLRNNILLGKKSLSRQPLVHIREHVARGNKSGRWCKSYFSFDARVKGGVCPFKSGF